MTLLVMRQMDFPKGEFIPTEGSPRIGTWEGLLLMRVQASHVQRVSTPRDLGQRIKSTHQHGRLCQRHHLCLLCSPPMVRVLTKEMIGCCWAPVSGEVAMSLMAEGLIQLSFLIGMVLWRLNLVRNQKDAKWSSQCLVLDFEGMKQLSLFVSSRALREDL